MKKSGLGGGGKRQVIFVPTITGLDIASLKINGTSLTIGIGSGLPPDTSRKFFGRILRFSVFFASILSYIVESVEYQYCWAFPSFYDLSYQAEIIFRLKILFYIFQLPLENRRF